MLRQKVLWVAVLLMTVVVLGSGLADAIVGMTDNSKRCKVLSGRVMDDAFLKEVQESENQEDYIVFHNFITACMGTSEHGLVDARQVYAAREESNESEMSRAGLTDGEKKYWHEKESEVKKPFTYSYEEGYAGIYTSVYVANFMLLLTAIAVCGIFADEKINGTDQIIFSSVRKETLFTAKVLAGLSIGFCWHCISLRCCRGAASACTDFPDLMRPFSFGFPGVC
jgi:hypothetical protein